MWGQHLKQRGKWWHYYRSVPNRFRDVDARSQICFALKTTDFFEAKLRAAQISRDLEQKWSRAVELVNRPLFAGDPEVRILGYGKEQM